MTFFGGSGLCRHSGMIYIAGQTKINLSFHTLNKGGIIIKQVKPIVHCIYTESNKSLTQLLDEYFRAYLSCSLEMTNKAMLPYLK